MHRAKVRPFTQVCLAENNRARISQALDDEGVPSGNRAIEGKRSGGRRHLIRRVDVVFDQNRNAVKSPAHPSRLSLSVERVGDSKGVGVELDDGMQRWTIAIERPDTRE